MKITVFNGSIHAERGNTQVVVDAFAAGAREAGAETEMVFLAKKKIRPCQACMSCWTKTPGVCAVKDDMAELLRLYMESDIAVYATPVYVDNVTAIMKLFIDRMIPVIDPHFELDENGVVRHHKRHGSYPGFVVISSCGFPGQEQFEIISAYFKRVAFHAHTRVLGEIFRDAAILLKFGEHTPLKPVVAAYKEMVATAGREIVTAGAISEKTATQIAQPFVPRELYISEANKYWDSRIAKASKASEER